MGDEWDSRIAMNVKPSVLDFNNVRPTVGLTKLGFFHRYFTNKSWWYSGDIMGIYWGSDGRPHR